MNEDLQMVENTANDAMALAEGNAKAIAAMAKSQGMLISVLTGQVTPQQLQAEHGQDALAVLGLAAAFKGLVEMSVAEAMNK